MTGRFGRLLGGVALLATTAAAQDTGGAQARFEIAPGLRYGDAGFAAVTDLGLDISSQTRAAVFDASLNTSLVLAAEDEDAPALGDPDLRLSYARESRDTALSTALRYRRTDLGEALVPFATDGAALSGAEEDLFRLDAGTRTDLTLSAGLEFGRTARFGGDLSYGFDRTRYEDTVDPDLLDSETQRLSGNLLFRIDDRITARLGASVSDRDVAAGGVDRRAEGVDLGLELAIDPLLTADISLGYDRVTRNGPDGTTRTEGTTLGLALERDMPNGTLSAWLGSSIGDDGRRTSLSFGRALDLSEVTSLSVDLGFSQQDAFGIDPVLGLNLTHELKRGALNASLSQAYTTTDQGETVRDTRADLSWTRALTRTAGLRTSLSLRDRDALAEGGTDLTRVDLGITYNQALTADWDAVASYARSYAREDGEQDRNGDTIFLGLSRSFDWRP